MSIVRGEPWSACSLSDSPPASIPEENLLGLVERGFYRPDLCPVTRPSTAVKAPKEYKTLTIIWSYPFFDHHQTPDRRGITPFALALRRQYRNCIDFLDLLPLRRWRSSLTPAFQVSYRFPPATTVFNKPSSFSQIQVHRRTIFLHIVQPLLSWSSSGPRSINASIQSNVEVFQ